MTHRDGELLQAWAVLMLDGPDPAREVERHGAMLLVDHLLCVGRRDVSTTQRMDDAAVRQAAQSALADRDDVDWSALTHPGSVTWPVAISIALENDLSGRDLWRAAQVGYEGTARTARLLGPDHRARFHPTSTAGIAGAALAAAAAFGYRADETSHALGHALSVMGGSNGCIRELSETRQFHRSHAVRTGIAAAEAARAGLQSTRSDLELGGGILEPCTDEARHGLLAPTWIGVESASVRVFPTSGWNQSVYEAAREAAASVDGQITKIVVHVPATQAASVNATDDPWVSVRHAVVATVDATASDRAALLDSVYVEADSQSGAHVTMLGADGSSSATIQHPLGHPERPIADEHLAEKWQIEPSRLTHCVDAVAELFETPHPATAARIVTLVETLSPSR